MIDYQDVAQKFVKKLRAVESEKGLGKKEMHEVMASVLPLKMANKFVLNPSPKTFKREAANSELACFVALHSPEYIKQRRPLHLSFRQAQFRMAQYLGEVQKSSKKTAILITDNWHRKLANWKLEEKIEGLKLKFNIAIYQVDLDDELILIDDKFEADLVLGSLIMPIEEYKKMRARVRRLRSLPEKSIQFLERVYANE